MRIGINAHPQAFGSLSRDIAMMLRLAPTFVRVSALQHGVISQERANRVKRMVDAGLKVVGLCTSEKCATMNDKAWVSYCKTYAKLASWAGTTYDQVGNEWNTQPFWGGKPDVRKAIERFKVAQDIIGRCCIAPGVTCENKNASNKISAVRWVKSFLADGADPLAFDLHYYATDERLKSVFDECVRILAGWRIVVLETGCATASKQAAWYKKVRGGIFTAAHEHVLWYSYNDSLLQGFALVDKNTKPSPLAKLILGGEI
jgi:hypothetical protein